MQHWLRGVKLKGPPISHRFSGWSLRSRLRNSTRHLKIATKGAIWRSIQYNFIWCLQFAAWAIVAAFLTLLRNGLATIFSRMFKTLTACWMCWSGARLHHHLLSKQCEGWPSDLSVAKDSVMSHLLLQFLSLNFMFWKFDVSDLFFEICVRRFRRADNIS